MDHLIGQRFSLISKSEIRYVGILYEINPEKSTIALEEVFSLGTEDRSVANYIPPSSQKFAYIEFKGSDVKDIKIEEESKEPKKPAQIPDDPAILNSSRPGPSQQSQGPPQGPPPTRGESPYPPRDYPPQGYGNYGYPPPPPGQFGRGYGPPPGPFGPGPGYGAYGPPPPGYYGPPGQGFPRGPTQFPPNQPVPIGPPGQRAPPQNQHQPPQQPPAPGPPAAPANKPTTELPVEKHASSHASNSSTPAPPAVVTEPPNPTDTIPTTSTATTQPQVTAKVPPAPMPAQPKSNRITPAMPFAVNQQSFKPPISTATAPSNSQSAAKPAKSHAEMEEASRQAKEAVANALAKLNPPTGPKPPQQQQSQQQQTATVDDITQTVSQIMTGPPAHRGRGNYRGMRGPRTSSGGQRPKMEIPQSDFDFESANAKFNKGDLIKEAIASGSPISEIADGNAAGNGVDSFLNGANDPVRKDSYSANPVPAYNKSSSFFDNISSEAKDREDGAEAKFNPRVQRGAEFKKNVETFGQGNVDSGYRGRGRGGYRGQRRGGGYRGRGRGTSNPAADNAAFAQN